MEEEVVSKPEEKTRVDVVNEVLVQYPIEEFLDWYKTNYPGVYAGYLHAKSKYMPKDAPPETVKEKAKVSLKMIGILVAILAIFGVIVTVVLIGLFSQVGSMFQ